MIVVQLSWIVSRWAKEEEECIVLDESVQENEKDEDYTILVHAFARQSTPDTIKLTRRVKNNKLSILVDTGSTHNFLDPQAAKRVGCKLEYTNPLLVTVADGGKMNCNSKCFGFRWEMGKHAFSSDV